MKKIIKAVLALIFLCAGILALLFIVPLVSGKKILVGHVPAPQLFFGTGVAFLLLCVVFVILRYRQHKCGKNLAVMIAVSVISTITLLGGSFLYLLFFSGSEVYYTFYSPDRKYSIVAEEWSWLLAGTVTLYERTSPFLVEVKEIIITDDGFRPIATGAYEIQWNGNVVTFTVETADWERGKETAVVELGMRDKK